MATRVIKNARGFVHDIEAVKVLSEESCNLRFLSDRTLYILQNLAYLDTAFHSRYGTILEGGIYTPVDPISSDGQVVDNANYNLSQELALSGCDELSAINVTLLAINDTLLAANQTGCGTCGSEIEDISEDWPSIGSGLDFETLPAYDTYRCKAANWIVDGLLDAFTKFAAYDLDFWVSTTVASGAALIWAIVITTFIGSLIVAVAGVVVAFTVALITGLTIDLEDIRDELISNRAALVCALYGGANAQDSKDRFLAELLSGGLNAAETALMGIILVMDILNNLFEFNPIIDAYTATTSCATCCEYIVPRLFGGETPVIEGQPGAWVMTLDQTNYGVSDYLARFDVYYDGTAYCGSEVQIKLTDLVFTALDEDPGKSVQILDQLGAWVYNSNSPPDPATEYCAAQVIITSSTAITLDFELGSECS